MQTRLSLRLSDNQRMEMGRAIRDARKAKKITQAGLGKLFGVSKSAVAQWESGKNMPDPRKLPDLIRILDLDPFVVTGSAMHKVTDSSLLPTGDRVQYSGQRLEPSAEPPQPPSRPAPDAPLRTEMPKDVPVLGTTMGGSRGDFSMNNGDPVDFARRPPKIKDRKDVFCLFVQGTSMSPWRQPGDLVYVEAARSPHIGDYVVVEMQPEADDLRPAFLKRLVKRSTAKITLEQFSPPRTFEVEMRRVGRILRIMDWSELLGS